MLSRQRVLLGVRIVVAAVLLLGGIGKILDPTEAGRTIRNALGIPLRTPGPALALGLAVIELYFAASLLLLRRWRAVTWSLACLGGVLLLAHLFFPTPASSACGCLGEVARLDGSGAVVLSGGLLCAGLLLGIFDG